MSKRIDLNADLGEAWGAYPLPAQTWRADWERTDAPLAPNQVATGTDLEQILRSVTSANIACGFHAGDPLSIQRYLAVCARFRLAVGAHPAYPDPTGFGNRSMRLSPADLAAVVQYQLAALDGLARLKGMRLQHVKLHGALYHDAHVNSRVAQTVAEAIACYDPRLVVFGLPVGELSEACRRVGLQFMREGFPDRAYTSGGWLVPRNRAGAVITDPEQVAERAVRMALEGWVTGEDGRIIELEVDTLCVHPDTPGAGQYAVRMRERLEAAGVRVCAFAGER